MIFNQPAAAGAIRYSGPGSSKLAKLGHDWLEPITLSQHAASRPVRRVGNLETRKTRVAVLMAEELDLATAVTISQAPGRPALQVSAA
jgi:hypothetical protein